MTNWLIEEPVDQQAVERSLILGGARRIRGPVDETASQSIAIRLHDVLVHNNKKWFDMLGGADIRLDAVVVQGNVLDSNPAAAYVPTTMHFAGIGDGDQLPSDEYGMLLYYGFPRHFLDISIIVSRDRRDSGDLATQLTKEMNSGLMKDAIATLLGLAVAAPTAAAVAGAITAAATIGNFAFEIVRATCGNTIGMYRGSRLAYPEQFGVGRNPSDGSAYRKGDFSFWYEVVSGPPASS